MPASVRCKFINYFWFRWKKNETKKKSKKKKKKKKNRNILISMWKMFKVVPVIRL